MMDNNHDCSGCGDSLPSFALNEDGACVSCILNAREVAVPTIAWADVRGHRDYLIGRTDWTQFGDQPQATRDAWTAVRQQLRDITEYETPDEAWLALVAIEAEHFG